MSLIAHYKIDGDVTDSSGNGYNGTASNLTYSTGKIGQGGSFNGTSSYFSFNNPLIQGSSFSISFWMKLNNNTDLMNFGCCRTTVGEGISIFLITSGFIRFDTGAPAPAYQWATTYAPPANEWIHITLTKDSSYKKLYVNGVFHSSTNVVGDMATLYSLFTVGASQASGSNFANYTNGYIDDYRIYNHALSQKEVKELSRAKVLHYDFDDFQEPTENNITSIGTVVNCTKSGNGVLINWVASPVDTYFFFNLKSGFTITTGNQYTVSFDCSGLPDGKTVQFAWSNVISGPCPAITLHNGRNTLTFIAPNTSAFLDDYTRDATISNLYLYNFQLEQKDHSTPFVNGSRTGVVRDISGYNNDATLALATTPQWTSDSKIGEGCYKFNSTRITLTDNDILSNFSQITLSAWVKINATPSSFGSIIHKGSSSNLGDPGTSFFLGFETTGRKPRVVLANSTTILDINSTEALLSDIWYFISATYDDTTVRLYINGVEKITGNLTGSLYDSNTDITIGYCSTNYYPFIGSIDDVHIYTTALSATDILELYQTRAQIDKSGNMFAQLFEESSTFNINELEYDENSYIESEFLISDITGEI